MPDSELAQDVKYVKTLKKIDQKLCSGLIGVVAALNVNT